MKFCLINTNRSIYSGVRCQKISFRRRSESSYQRLFAQLLTLFCLSHDALLVLQCSCSAESCWNSYQSAGDKAHTGRICSNNEEPSKPRIPPPPLHNINNIIKTVHLQLGTLLPPLQPLSCSAWPWRAPHSSVQCHGSKGGGRFSNGV